MKAANIAYTVSYGNIQMGSNTKEKEAEWDR